MLHGFRVPCLDRFLGRIFSQFVRTRMGVLGIDTFSRACSFPGSFWPCAGPQGVNYAPWPQCYLFGPLFGPYFFTICADSFRPCAVPQGVNYAPWPQYPLFGPPFGPHFFTICADKSGVLGIDTFSRACSFPGSFRPCADPQGVNYAPWPRCQMFGPLFGPHFFTICADSFRPCVALQGVNYALWPQYPLFGSLFGLHFFTICADKNGVLGIDTCSRACSFLGSFRPCAGPQGVNYAQWPQCHLFGPLFGPHFFTICADSFRPCAVSQGVNYAPWPQYPLFGPLFGPHFFTIGADKNGVLGIDTFSRACSFPGSFRPCADPQGVNYAPWPRCQMFGPLFGPHFFTICADSFRPCAAPQAVNYAPWPQYHLFGPLFGPHFFTICADKNGSAWDRYLQ